MDVKLNTIIEDNNIIKSKFFKIYNEVMDNLDISIDTSLIKKEYPSISFPESQDINIIFMRKDKELLDFVGLNENTQGVFLTVNTDGLLKEMDDEYPDSFNVIVFIDDNKMESIIEQEAFLDMSYGIPLDVSREGILKSIANTLTHELEHAIEFMTNSGGLTPHQVNELNQSGKFGYDVYSCMTGYGTESFSKDFIHIDEKILEDDLPLNMVADEIEEIVEARVESNSMKKLESMDIDFNAIYKAEAPKSKKSKKFSSRYSP